MNNMLKFPGSSALSTMWPVASTVGIEVYGTVGDRLGCSTQTRPGTQEKHASFLGSLTAWLSVGSQKLRIEV